MPSRLGVGFFLRVIVEDQQKRRAKTDWDPIVQISSAPSAGGSGGHRWGTMFQLLWSLPRLLDARTVTLLNEGGLLGWSNMLSGSTVIFREIYPKKAERTRVDWIYLPIPETASKSPYTNGGKGRRAGVLLGLYRPIFRGTTCCYSWKRDITSPDILFRWLWFSLMSNPKKTSVLDFFESFKGLLGHAICGGIWCVSFWWDGISTTIISIFMAASLNCWTRNDGLQIACFDLPYSAFVSTKLCQKNGSICAPC